MVHRLGAEPFLRALFDSLREAGCRYAVMRNYESLPSSTGGSDLDILARDEREFAAVRGVIRSVVQRMSLAPVGELAGRWFYQVHLLGTDGEGGYWGCRIDLYPGVNFKGHSITDIDWDGDTRQFNGVTVLVKDLAALIGVVKSMLTHGEVPSRYREPIIHLDLDRTDDVRRWLTPIGMRGCSLVLKGISSPSSEKAAQAAVRRELRSASRRHQVLAEPFSYFHDAVSWQLSKLARFFRPSGVLVAILGTDGVGKSTVVEGVLPVLKEATHGACQLRHLRPGLLPPLSRLKGAPQSEPGPVVDPHGSEPSGTVASLARIGWLLVDYLIGYWLRVRPFIAKQPGIFLFDRYAYDMAIDPRRFRIALPDRLIWWLARLAPRPDLIVCLHASPSTILNRKQELPEQEVRRQLDALAAFAAREPRAVIVSTEGTQEEVRERVLQVLHDFFDRRARAKRIRANAA